MYRVIIALMGLLFTIPLSAQRFFPVKIDQKWGLIDAKGNVTLQPKYDAIGAFKEFGYAVMQRNGGVGLLNESGKEIVEPKFDDLKVLDSTLVAVMNHDNWLVINLLGKVVLEPGYERVQVWKQQWLAYQRDGKWGIVDVAGRQICAPNYDEIRLFEEKYFLTRMGEKVGLLTWQGEEILPAQYAEIRPYSDQLFFFKSGKKWGIKTLSKGILPNRFDSWQPVSKRFLRLTNGGRSHLFSLSAQKIITKEPFDAFFEYSNQYILARRRQFLGLLNSEGKLILPTQYTEIQAFGENGFRVKKGLKWGVVTKTNELLVPFEYDYIAPLKGSVCVAKKDRFLGILNLTGENVVPCRFTKIELEKNKANAYINEAINILQFNEEGQLEDASNFKNHFTITVRGKEEGVPFMNTGFETNYVLNDFEWFYAPTLDKWGLRRLSDGTIQIEPTFDEIQIERDLGFTVVGIERLLRHDFDLTTYRFEMVYGIVNNSVGLLVTEVNLWDIRLRDFDQGLSAARCIFANGRHGLISRKEGQIGKILVKDYAYIGEFKEGWARMSTKGKLSGEIDADYQSLGNLQGYLRTQLAPNQMLDYTEHDREFTREADLICEGCKWGYIDADGEIQIPQQYSFAKDIVNKVGIVKCKGKWGMISQNGQEILPCNYDGVSYLENTNDRILRIYKSGEKYGLIDTLGQLRVALQYDEIGEYAEDKLAVKRNGLWGFVDVNGVEIVPCQFREALDFSEGLAAVKLGNKWGYINQANELVIDYQYIRCGSFVGGMAPAYAEQAFGYIDISGQWKIKPQFDFASDFDKGIAIVKNDFKYGLINRQGEYIERPKYLEISSFDENNLAKVKYDSDRKKYGLINREGNVKTTLNFKIIRPFQEGLAAVRYRDSWGFINTRGNLVVDAIYSEVGDFSEGRAMVKRGGLCGYIDSRGNEIIPPTYSKCLDFDGGRAVVYQGYRKGGLINQDGKVLIEPGISRLYDFSDGRGRVRGENYRFYYITEQARLYDGFYQKAGKFQHGVATVQVGGRWGIINQKGIEIIPPKYDRIEDFENGFARVRIQGFSGLTNLKGELIVAPDFEYISYAGNGLFRVEEGDKVGYFDMNGEWIWALSE